MNITSAFFSRESFIDSQLFVFVLSISCMYIYNLVFSIPFKYDYELFLDPKIFLGPLFLLSEGPRWRLILNHCSLPLVLTSVCHVH